MIVHQFLIILAPHGLERVLLPLHHGSLRGPFGPLSTLGAPDLLIPLLMLGIPPAYGLLADYHLGLTELIVFRMFRGLHLRCDPVMLGGGVLMSVEDRCGALAEAAGIGEEVGFALAVAAGVRVEGSALGWLVFGGPQSQRARVLHGPLEKFMGDRFVRKKRLGTLLERCLGEYVWRPSEGVLHLVELWLISSFIILVFVIL